MSEKLRVKVDGKWYSVEVVDLSSKPIRTIVDGHPVEVNIEDAKPVDVAPVLVPEQTDAVAAQRASSNSSPTRQVAPQPRPVPQEAPAPRTGEPTGNVLVAPMPGTILSVDVRVGDPIQAGDHVCTLEAMKMQQSLRAEWTGVISDVFVNPGDQVQDNAPLLAIG